nr:unnamed protein product [Digitaria exilis]
MHSSMDYCAIQSSGVAGVSLLRRTMASSVVPPAATSSETKRRRRPAGESFIRQHLRSLVPYQPILPFETSSMELKHIHIPAQVATALGNLKFPNVYPDPESRHLRAALAQACQLESEYILVGSGANELIDLVMRCVLEPGDEIVVCPPAFTMYEFDASVNGALVIKVSYYSQFIHSFTIINDEDLVKILDLPILVVLDEAYIEFSNLQSRMSWVKIHDNLIVLRTFSKLAGLAGLRVGYEAFPLSIIEYVWRAKQPYNISVAAEVSACATLQNPAYLEVPILQSKKKLLYNLLQGMPFLKPFPSHSNYILCEVTSGKDAKKIKGDLAKIGLMIRHCDTKEMKGYIRSSAGKPEHTDALIEGLKAVLQS